MPRNFFLPPTSTTAPVTAAPFAITTVSPALNSCDVTNRSGWLSSASAGTSAASVIGTGEPSGIVTIVILSNVRVTGVGVGEGITTGTAGGTITGGVGTMESGPVDLGGLAGGSFGALARSTGAGAAFGFRITSMI